MRLRGGKIEWKLNRFAGKIWAALYETASRRLIEDSSIQDQLQSARLWLFPETEDERSDTERKIKYLEGYGSRVERLSLAQFLFLEGQR